MAGTKGTRRRVGRIATGAAFAFALAAAVLVLVPALIGWQRYAIVSGSMTGTYDKGSLVLDEVVPVRDLRVGDVITYLPPAGDHLITHRISWIGRDATGARVFRTKGDANPVADGWTFKLDRETQARVRVGVPDAGYVLAALGRRDVRMVLIALPALLIAGISLVGLWRRLGAMAEATA
ncbi:MAG TPA: signal peptidase I [Solirubrobacteraceae bacterium]|nr:signal peptidase I [Solirubrobacteraceae bacterium]